MIRAVHMDNLRGFFGIRMMDSLKCTDKEIVWTDKSGR